jgi:hypothetical protein
MPTFMHKLEDYIGAAIDAMSADDLRAVIAECDKMTTANCSWVRYGLRDIMREIAEAQLAGIEAQQEANIEK